MRFQIPTKLTMYRYQILVPHGARFFVPLRDPSYSTYRLPAYCGNVWDSGLVYVLPLTLELTRSVPRISQTCSQSFKFTRALFRCYFVWEFIQVNNLKVRGTYIIIWKINNQVTEVFWSLQIHKYLAVNLEQLFLSVWRGRLTYSLAVISYWMTFRGL